MLGLYGLTHPQNEGHILSQKKKNQGHINEYVNIDEWSQDKIRKYHATKGASDTYRW